MSGGDGSWGNFHLHLPDTPGTVGSGTPTPRQNDDVYYPHMSHIPNYTPPNVESTADTEPMPDVDGEESPNEDDGNPSERNRDAYTPAETEKLFATFVAVSEDPIVGNQQRLKVFWDRVEKLYNKHRPKKTVYRHYRKLQAHFYRVNAEIKKFNGNFIAEEAKAGSGSSGVDVYQNALDTYLQDNGKHFKYTSTWKQVRHLDKWASGFQSESGSGGRRGKRTSTESEPSSEGVTQPDRSGRPMGVKAAKAARKGKGKAGASQDTTEGRPADKTTLYGYLTKLSMVDVSDYDPQRRAVHFSLIRSIQAELGIPPE